MGEKSLKEYLGIYEPLANKIIEKGIDTIEEDDILYIHQLIRIAIWLSGHIGLDTIVDELHEEYAERYTNVLRELRKRLKNSPTEK